MYVSKFYLYKLGTIVLFSNRNIDFVLIYKNEYYIFGLLSNDIHIFFFQYSYCWMLQKRKCKWIKDPIWSKSNVGTKRNLWKRKFGLHIDPLHDSYLMKFFLTKSNNIYTLCRVINHSANIFLVIFLSPYWSSLFSLFMFFRW